MTRPALLDNVTHRQLRIRTERSAALGDARQFALALPAEFRQLQAHFPIVFQHVEGSVGFQPIVLLGLEEGQNLFLTDAGWDAPVVPMALQRDPFMIGRGGDDLKLHIDLDSPRIVKPEEGEVGTAVFMPHGGHSEYLDHVVSLLEHLHAHAQHLPDVYSLPAPVRWSRAFRALARVMRDPRETDQVLVFSTYIHGGSLSRASILASR